MLVNRVNLSEQIKAFIPLFILVQNSLAPLSGVLLAPRAWMPPMLKLSDTNS